MVSKILDQARNILQYNGLINISVFVLDQARFSYKNPNLVVQSGF